MCERAGLCVVLYKPAAGVGLTFPSEVCLGSRMRVSEPPTEDKLRFQLVTGSSGMVFLEVASGLREAVALKGNRNSGSAGARAQPGPRDPGSAALRARSRLHRSA